MTDGEIWKLLESAATGNLISILVAISPIAYWVTSPLFRRRRLRKDVELLGALRAAEVDVPEPFIDSVQTRTTALLDPRPWGLSFSQLWTLVIVVFIGLSLLRTPWEGWLWPVKIWNTVIFLSVMLLLFGDFLWCHWHWFRGTRLGFKLAIETKLLGDSPHGIFLIPRRAKVIARDRRLNRLDQKYLDYGIAEIERVTEAKERIRKRIEERKQDKEEPRSPSQEGQD